MVEFLFDIGIEVKISCSQESGEIIGRAQYAESGNQYFLRYTAADGRAIEDWWSEPAIELLYDAG